MEKKFRYGFTLGKFMPPHEGHLYLIREALEQVEQLTVLVCSVKKEPIDGELRYDWMKKIFSDNNRVRLIHITDEVPSYPNEHPDFENIWTQLLKQNIHPETEVFFSSEEYGYDVAKWLKITHIKIDQERKSFPVSATAIRENPFQNWEYIPTAVRPYYLKRIVLIGPESTGKTTLAEKLANYFNTEWVPEYGRQHFVEVNGKLTINDISLIADGQLKAENTKAATAEKLLFCDTDLIVTQIWSEIYFNECPQWILDINQNRHYALYLLMDIDIPWVDDGTREFPNLREWHFNRLQEELDDKNKSYKIISGNFEQRLQKAIEAVTNLISAKS